jgi:hypothetical protein
MKWRIEPENLLGGCGPEEGTWEPIDYIPIGAIIRCAMCKAKDIDG